MNESDRRSQDVQSWKQLYRAAVLETNMKFVPRIINMILAVFQCVDGFTTLRW